MPEEWFEVAYINFDKAILHGRVMEETSESGGTFLRGTFKRERYIEQVLTVEQKRQIEDLNFEHDQAMQKLLRSFVNEDC